MAAPDSAESREFRQMRNDVDDSYALLEGMAKSITTISATQRRHGNRLEEIQQSVDLQSGRLDRMEDNQRQQADRLGRVEGRLNGVEDRLTAVDGRLEGVDGRLGSIEGTQQQILDLLRGRPAG
jgi:hypothetical protein